MKNKLTDSEEGYRRFSSTAGLAIPRADETSALGGNEWPGSSPSETSSGRLLVMWLGIYTFMGRRLGRAGRAMNAPASPSPFRWL
jgi:hypothetical protein